MDVLASNDLEMCLIDAKFLTLDSVGSEESNRVASELLFKITHESHPEHILVQVALYLKELAIMHVSVSTILLDSLGSLKQPALFLDILPDIFASSPKESIEELAEKLFKFASDDHLFVRSLAVLVDLPLESQLSETTRKLASKAIHSVSPQEYPTLFRVTMKAANGRDIIIAWRKKVLVHFGAVILLFS